MPRKPLKTVQRTVTPERVAAVTRCVERVAARSPLVARIQADCGHCSLEEAENLFERAKSEVVEWMLGSRRPEGHTVAAQAGDWYELGDRLLGTVDGAPAADGLDAEAVEEAIVREARSLRDSDRKFNHQPTPPGDALWDPQNPEVKPSGHTHAVLADLGDAFLRALHLRLAEHGFEGDLVARLLCHGRTRRELSDEERTKGRKSYSNAKVSRVLGDFPIGKLLDAVLSSIEDALRAVSVAWGVGDPREVMRIDEMMATVEDEMMATFDSATRTELINRLTALHEIEGFCECMRLASHQATY